MHESRDRVVALLRSLVVLGAGNYGAMAVSLGINALLTRRLGPETFGHLTLLLMASQVMLMLVANWTQAGIIRFGAQEFSTTGSVAETFWTRVWIVAPWAALGAAAMVAAHGPLADYLSIPAWGLAIVSLHFVASFVQLSAGAAFQARNEMSRYGATLFFDKATLALLLLLPLGVVSSPLTLLGMYAASSVTVAVWALTRLGRRSLLPIVFDGAAYRRMLIFSIPLIVSSWVGLLGTNWIDFMVIKRYRPISEIGLYALGVLLAGVVQQVTIVFSTLLLPQLSVMVARGEYDRIRTVADRVLPYWLLATSVLFSVVLIGARVIVPLVFGAGFARSATILALLMPAAAALALFSAFAPLVIALGSTWVLTGIYLASGVVNVGLDLLLIPTYGIEGSAVATTLSYATSAVMVLLFAGARLNGRLYPLAWMTLPVVVVLICFLWLDGPSFYVVALLAGALAVYGLMRRFQLFRGEDAVFFESLRLSAPLLPGMSLVARRR